MVGRKILMSGTAIVALMVVASDFAQAASGRRALRRAARQGGFATQQYGHGHGYVSTGATYCIPCGCETGYQGGGQQYGPPEQQQGVEWNGQAHQLQGGSYQNQPRQPYSVGRPVYDNNNQQPPAQLPPVEGGMNQGQQRNNQYFPDTRSQDLNGRIEGNLQQNPSGANGVDADVNAARQASPNNR